ncbi:hypothetical protein TWF718_009244 [Orbilia javanica]|uniref:Peptidase A1 domain-containing protein n=1 Tax=Orbilia javanica TaxID=47235 RepID=A0AAN8MLW8_9PEZI
MCNKSDKFIIIRLYDKIIKRLYTCSCADKEPPSYDLDNRTSGRIANETMDFGARVDGNEDWASGELVEDIVTVGEVQVSLKFLAAKKWGKRKAPFFGLGLNFPVDNTSTYDNGVQRFSYLSALSILGKIGAKVCSLYNIMDTGFGGEIILGGVDRSKFYGYLDIYDGYPGQPYTMDFPTVGIGKIEDPGSFMRYDSISGEPPISLSQFNHAVVPKTYALSLKFKKALINIPLRDLVQNVPGSLCPVLIARADGVSSLGGPFFKAAYIVLEPETGRIAIASSIRNTSSSDVVEISNGPLSFGLGSALLVIIVGVAVTVSVIYGRERQRKPMPDIPRAEYPTGQELPSAFNPSELNSRRSMGELGVYRGQALRCSCSMAVVQELPIVSFPETHRRGSDPQQSLPVSYRNTVG